MEKLLKEIRAKLARLQELRAKTELTDAEKTERRELPGSIEGLNAQYEELKKEERLLEGLNTSIVTPPGGNEPHTPGVIEDKPVYRSFGEQLQDICSIGGANLPGIEQRDAVKRLGEYEKREKELRSTAAVSNYDSESGGVLVQSDFALDIVDKGFNNGAVVSKCSQRNLSSGANALDIYGIDEDSRAEGARYGGIRVFTKSEMEKYSPSKTRFAKIGMKVDKITGLLFLSDEIMQDAAFLEGEVKDLFPKAFAYKLQDLVLTGTGAGEPLGILNAPALLTVSKDSGQGAKTITTENISKMKVGAAGNAEWFANRDIIPQLEALQIGTGAAARMLFKQLTINTGQLDGIPITFIEQSETLGEKGDLVLADFGQYVLLRKGNIKEFESLHFKFDQGLKAIRWDLRVDGQPRWKNPLSPAKGNNKISPFVALAKRG